MTRIRVASSPKESFVTVMGKALVTWFLMALILLVASTAHADTVTITADDAPKTILEQGQTSGTFRISRTSTGSPLTVTLTPGGTATQNSDYLPISWGVTIGATTLDATVTITASEDSIDEADETVTATIAASADYVVGSPSSASITIIDNDLPPTVQFDSSSSAGLESASPVIFPVSLSTASGRTVTVPYTVSGTASGSGTDYTLASGTLTFNAGSRSPVQNISASITNDSLYEANETIIVTLGTPVNATPGANTIHIYTINDNDLAPTVQFADAISNGPESVTSAAITVTLSAASGLDVTVPFSLSGSSALNDDYTTTSSPLIIPAGLTSGDITLTIVNDTTHEPDETIVLNMGTPTNATQGAQTSHTRTIVTSDSMTSVQFINTISNNSESVTSPTVTVSLAEVSGYAVSVNYAVTDGSAAGDGVDYTLTSGTLTFNPGETSKNIPLSIVNDLVDEPNETIVVSLNSPVNATIGASSSHTYTIADDDVLPPTSVTISATDASAYELGLETGTFTLTRSGVTTDSLTVTYAVSGTAAAGIDYAALSGVVTFEAGSSTATMTVTPILDKLIESTETVAVTLSSGADYATGAPSQATISIFSLALPTLKIKASDKAAFEPSDPGAILISRNGVTTSDLTVYLSVSGTAQSGVDYEALPLSVTIPAGLVSATLPVNTMDDLLPEPDETIVVTLVADPAYVLGRVTAATIKLKSNDLPTVTITANSVPVAEGSTVPRTFTIVRDNDYATLKVSLAVTGTATAKADYLPLPKKLTFPIGIRSLTISLTPVNDGLVEADETATLSLLPNAKYSIGNPSSASVTIKSDDEPSDQNLSGNYFYIGLSSRDDLEGYLTESGSLTIGADGRFALSTTNAFDHDSDAGQSYVAASATDAGQCLLETDGSTTCIADSVVMTNGGLSADSATLLLASPGMDDRRSIGIALKTGSELSTSALSGSYHLAYLVESSSGVSASIGIADFDGAGLISYQGIYSDPAAGPYALDAFDGTYAVADNGLLDVAVEGAMIKGGLSANGDSLAWANVNNEDAREIGFAILLGNGHSNASLTGAYYQVMYITGTEGTRSTFATLTFDGTGAFTETRTYSNETGANQSESVTGTYVVLDDGMFQLTYIDRVIEGSLSADGQSFITAQVDSESVQSISFGVKK